jgi:flagellin-like hook-associated protein FlgL
VLIYSGGTLSSDLVLQIGGKSGFETLNFGSGTTVDRIASAINQISDAIGVSASVASSATSGSVLRLESVEYGSDAFVSAKALNTGAVFNVIDTAGASTDRTNGTDVALRINGVQATGKGLRASLNTSTLDLNFEVNSQLQDGDSFSFSITGGGANFQIGPDVVSNQQARLGIQGLSTATLGGVSGKLYELRSGGAKDLSTDTKGAAKVVDEVITSVTGLRGRLGAFQRTTLETNIFTLNDVLENLTDAESTIRDADFAAESARLTRAQILVQSGTSVLQIANQNPQNVLALLR